MKFSELFGFLTILLESLKLIPKNGKLMGFIAILILVTSSSLFMLFSFSLRSLVLDMVKSLTHISDPTQSAAILDHIKEDTALMFALEIAFILVNFIISFFEAIATILVSAMSYHENSNFSFRDLFLKTGETWKRPLITTLYVSGLGLGYFTFVFLLLAPLFIYRNFITTSLIVFIGTASFILYLYLFVIWGLAIVISIVEEKYYGVKALGKAAALAKGKRLHGFMLNVCFGLVVLAISLLSYFMNKDNKRPVFALIHGLLLVSISSLLKVFGYVVYSVLYFHCKKHHGEEIDIHGIVQYTKIPTSLLANEMP